jgi:hypothetical protein
MRRRAAMKESLIIGAALVACMAVLAFTGGFTQAQGLSPRIERVEADQVPGEEFPETDQDEALELLGTSAGPTMSCFVGTPAKFTPNRCFGVVPGATYATAVFRVDPPLPENFEVQWDGDRPNAQCNPLSSVCKVLIQAFLPATVTATVLDLDNFTWFRVSATALFENGR